jgi:hypothetical protein
LQTDFGKFASNLGYETNYAKDNNHFSRAYLFNFLPFYHSGVRLTLPVSDDVTLMYMLTNGIQRPGRFGAGAHTGAGDGVHELECPGAAGHPDRRPHHLRADGAVPMGAAVAGLDTGSISRGRSGCRRAGRSLD